MTARGGAATLRGWFGAVPGLARGRLRLGLAALGLAAALTGAVPVPADAATFVAAKLFRSPALVAGPTVVFARPFTDVDEGPVADAFALLAALDIFRGGTTGPEGPVHPERAVTRADLVAVAVRLAGLEVLAAAGGGDGGLPFADAGEIPEWVRGYARVAFGEGLVRGIPEEGRLLFAAARPVRRADAARLLARVVERSLAPREGWAEEVRQAVTAALAEAAGWAPPGEAGSEGLSRGQMALMVERSLRLTAPADGGGAGTLFERNYDARRGVLGYVDLERRRLSLAGEDGRETRLEMEGRLFLRGASSLEALKGREVLVVGPDRRVACIEPAGGR